MSISNTPKMICVCLTNGTKCDNDPYVAEVKGTTHLYCCQRGFEQSLKDFLAWTDSETKHFKNN